MDKWSNKNKNNRAKSKPTSRYKNGVRKIDAFCTWHHFHTNNFGSTKCQQIFFYMVSISRKLQISNIFKDYSLILHWYHHYGSCTEQSVVCRKLSSSYISSSWKMYPWLLWSDCCNKIVTHAICLVSEFPCFLTSGLPSRLPLSFHCKLLYAHRAHSTNVILFGEYLFNVVSKNVNNKRKNEYFPRFQRVVCLKLWQQHSQCTFKCCPKKESYSFSSNFLKKDDNFYCY